MIVLFYSRDGVSSEQASAFDFVLKALVTDKIVNLDKAEGEAVVVTPTEGKRSEDKEFKEESKEEAKSVSTALFLGNAARLSALKLKAGDTIYIIPELSWNVPAACKSWSLAELPYRIGPSDGVHLIPHGVEPFYSATKDCVPTWEEALKGKCRKAVLCSVRGTSWNIMRSNEQLRQPPFAIPRGLQDFLDASTARYAAFFPTLFPPNHVWLERLHASYCSMGFHSDRRLDLLGDIRVYTDYSSTTTKNHIRTADDLSILFDPKRTDTFLRQAGIRFLEVKRKGEDEKEIWKIPMPAGSLLVISADANARLQHAIRGQPSLKLLDEALVITYRCSNTWVRSDKDERKRVCLCSNGVTLERVCRHMQPIKYAKWLALCSEDNKNIVTPFSSPHHSEAATWCVSPADLLSPIQLGPSLACPKT